jgi:transglutaminase-like putative cysteine protease
MGSGPELSDQVVMTVELEGDLPVSPQPGGEDSAPRFYWRSLTYDRYTGRGWQTSELRSEDYERGEPIQAVEGPSRWELTQSYRLLETSSGLSSASDDYPVYSSGELVTVDQEFSVAWRSPEDLFGAVVHRPVYQTKSLITLAGERALLAAEARYPRWIVARYLSLPQDVPARIYSLARELTATVPTPYQRAGAIEAYLRSFPYTLEVSAPPADRDVADYFLFELRRGYCDYYATAMVVLARAAGLPSRFVVGYASGRYDPDSGRYIVTAVEAHSWAEVYFSGIGWVAFEPTAGRPGLTRPDEPPLSSTLTRESEPGNFPVPGGDPPGLSLFGLLIALSLGIWIALDMVKIRKYAGMSPDETIRFLYREMNRNAHRLAMPVEVSATPREFGSIFLASLSDLASGDRRRRVIMPAGRDIRHFVDLYARSAYSQHPPDEADQKLAIRTWFSILWRLRFASVVKAMASLSRRLSWPD